MQSSSTVPVAKRLGGFCLVLCCVLVIAAGLVGLWEYGERLCFHLSCALYVDTPLCSERVGQGELVVGTMRGEPGGIVAVYSIDRPVETKAVVTRFEARRVSDGAELAVKSNYLNGKSWLALQHARILTVAGAEPGETIELSMVVSIQGGPVITLDRDGSYRMTVNFVWP
jgi:hypothetical protein